ncbi:MAG: 50S ribosomal protein L30 [bacterium]
MAGKIRVTLVRSGIGRPETQKRTLKGLGLTRLNRSVILEDTAEVRGMVRKVSHLVVVSPVEGNRT